jgi:predicted TIM-barrel fold metal-dependent hydrolase
MTSDARRSIHRLISFLEANQNELVIDMDTHITDTMRLQSPVRERYESRDGYYHGRPISAEDLLCEMNLSAVDMALIWQNPAATPYTEDHDENAERLLSANRYIRESADRFPNRFIPAGWTDPKACGPSNALRIAEYCVREFGFPIVKMNPAQNGYPMDSPEVAHVVDRIIALGAVPAFHFGADTPFTPAEGLETIACRRPGHPVLAVHMGGGGAGYVQAENLYHQARDLGLRRTNIRYIWSARRDAHIENDAITYQLAGPPVSSHIFCGSDAPYGRLSWNFGGFRAMFASLSQAERHDDRRVRSNPGLFDTEVTRAYLGANAARFVLSACRFLLEVHDLAAARVSS